MIDDIRIYIEGGGQGKSGKTFLRSGFRKFFQPLLEAARAKRLQWNVIPCGSRASAFKTFSTARKQHPTAFCVLLVDSEAPVTMHVWQHLRDRDNLHLPGVPDECGHLMVQVMEAWLIADRAALEAFYGKGFRPGALPDHNRVEEMEPKMLLDGLNSATKATSKGPYHKIRHAHKLLESIDSNTVRHAAPHCDRLFRAVEDRIRKARAR